MKEYPCTKPITINGRISAGQLSVVAEARDTVTVVVTPFRDDQASEEAAEHTKVELSGGTLTIEAPEGGTGWLLRRSGEIRVEVHVPLDCTVRLRSGSADLTCAGRLASGSLATGSGDIRAEHFAGDLSVANGSGDVQIGRVDGSLSGKCASGDFRVDVAGHDSHATSASGNVTVHEAGGSFRGNSASGDIRVDSIGRGKLRATTVSGDVTVGVREGTGVWLDLLTGSGTTRSDLDVSQAAPKGRGPDLSIQVRTASGDIEVRRGAVHQATA